MSHELVIIENDPKHGEHGETHLQRMGSRAEEMPDMNAKLALAQREVLNDNIYRRFLRSVLEIDNMKDPTNKIHVENKIISYLLDLPDAQIVSIIEQFNRKFKDFVLKHIEKGVEPFMTPEQRRKIFENDKKFTKEISGNIHPESVLGIVHFIRARKKLLALKPAQSSEYFVHDVLDARYKIDLVECIFDDDGNVDIMNLVQMKSSTPSEEEVAKIVADHKLWVESVVMDFETYEREFKDGLPDGLSIEKYSSNTEEIETLLLDLCTAPEGFNADAFIQNLDLGDLSNKHKAWLLSKFGADLRQKIDEAIEHGMIEPSYAEAIKNKLDELEDKLQKKAVLPKDLSQIRSINSIIAVGPKIVVEKPLVVPTEDLGKVKIAKVKTN